MRSQEPSGRTEIKQCISVQEDFQYGFRVDVFFQADCVGAAAMWRVTFVVCSRNGPPTAKRVQALCWTCDRRHFPNGCINEMVTLRKKLCCSVKALQKSLSGDLQMKLI